MSYPMYEAYLYSALRYVERNPVRAGIVKKAEDYNWSSAKAHVLKTKDKLLSDNYMLKEIRDWSEYLAGEEKDNDLKLLRKCANTGRPLGDEKFCADLEDVTGRILRKRRPGRKKLKIALAAKGSN